MGREIDREHFHDADFARFREHLRAETELLAQWTGEHRFADEHPRGGFELEAWLLDANFQPAMIYDEFRAAVPAGEDARDLIAPELARFNVELNHHPRELRHDALRGFEKDLGELWSLCGRTGREAFDARLMMIGILPTLAESGLCLANISRGMRYHALNEQILRLREGLPLELNIVGRERLHVTHEDVMLEAATASFQIHFQAPRDDAVRLYNASLIATAPLVAVGANAPYLFGKDLWEETRIPLFEEAVESGGLGAGAWGPLRRVSFGSGYARRSLLEVFQENLEHYPVLLPIDYTEADARERLRHLRLHNGTIWRWVRPLIGFCADGRPHFRIEQRVTAGGPTVTDHTANMAFYFGLAWYWARLTDEAPETHLEFAVARDNFYNAARHGLGAHLHWFDDRRCTVKDAILKDLLPLAARGLDDLGLDGEDSGRYLEIIRARTESGHTGAHWQRAFCEKYGRDMTALTRAYYERQESGAPVHTWDL